MNKILLFLFQYFTISLLSAQSLEQVVSPLLNAKNISYTAYRLHKDIFSEKQFRDTIFARFDYSSTDTVIKIQTREYGSWKDVNKLILFDYPRSTYRIKDAQEFSGLIGNSFVGRLNRLLKDMPKSKMILPVKDTIVNGIDYNYYQFTSSDTIKNGKRIFESRTILVDKRNQMPVYLRTDSEGFINDGKTHIVFFEEQWIHDLKFDDPNFEDISDMRIPDHIKLEVPKNELPLLEKGIVAPSLNFKNKDGLEMKISDFKGKMVLLNVTWVGCAYCMASITMLNDLHDKYKKEDLEIISIYPLDKEDDVLTMKEDFNVKYDYFKNTNTIKSDLENFNMSGYPTFYLIDKQGKIIKGWSGYTENISKEILSTIADNL